MTAADGTHMNTANLNNVLTHTMMSADRKSNTIELKFLQETREDKITGIALKFRFKQRITPIKTTKPPLMDTRIPSVLGFKDE